MKKRNFSNFKTFACATASFVASGYLQAVPCSNTHLTQNTGSPVDSDLEKVHAARDARDLDSLGKLVDSDSQKWKATDHSTFLAYMYSACGDLSSYEYPNGSKRAELLTKYSLEVLASGHLSLEDRVRFVEFLGYDSPDLEESSWRRVRSQKAELWLDTWRQLAESRDPKFDVTNVPMINVDPPPGSGVPAGASPESVKDPKLRADYKRILDRNRAKIERFNEQQYIRMNADRFYEEAERYLLNAYSKPPWDSAELERLLREKRIDPAVRIRLLKEVTEH